MLTGVPWTERRSGAEKSSDIINSKSEKDRSLRSGGHGLPISRRAFFTDPAALAIFHAANNGTLDPSTLPSHLGTGAGIRPQTGRECLLRPSKSVAVSGTSSLSVAASTDFGAKDRAITREKNIVAGRPKIVSVLFLSEPALYNQGNGEVLAAKPSSPPQPSLFADPGNATSTAAASSAANPVAEPLGPLPAASYPPAALAPGTLLASSQPTMHQLQAAPAASPPDGLQSMVVLEYAHSVRATASAPAPQPSAAMPQLPSVSAAAVPACVPPPAAMPSQTGTSAAVILAPQPAAGAALIPSVRHPPLLCPAPMPVATKEYPQVQPPALQPVAVLAQLPLPVATQAHVQRLISLPSMTPVALLPVTQTHVSAPQATPSLFAAGPPVLGAAETTAPPALLHAMKPPPVGVLQTGAKSSMQNNAGVPPAKSDCEAAVAAATAALEACLQPVCSISMEHKELRIRAVLTVAMSRSWDACMQHHFQGHGKGKGQGGDDGRQPPPTAGNDDYSPTRLQLLQFGWTVLELDTFYQQIFPPYPPGRMQYATPAIMYEETGRGIAARGLRAQPGGKGADMVLVPWNEWGGSRVAVMDRLRTALAPLEAMARHRQEGLKGSKREGDETATGSAIPEKAAGSARKHEALPWYLKEVSDRIRLYLRFILRPLLGQEEAKPLPLADVLNGLLRVAKVKLDSTTVAALGACSVESLIASMSDVVEVLWCGEDDGGWGLVPSRRYRDEMPNNKNGMHRRFTGGRDAVPHAPCPLPAGVPLLLPPSSQLLPQGQGNGQGQEQILAVQDQHQQNEQQQRQQPDMGCIVRRISFLQQPLANMARALPDARAARAWARRFPVTAVAAAEASEPTTAPGTGAKAQVAGGRPIDSGGFHIICDDKLEPRHLDPDKGVSFPSRSKSPRGEDLDLISPGVEGSVGRQPLSGDGCGNIPPPPDSCTSTGFTAGNNGEMSASAGYGNGDRLRFATSTSRRQIDVPLHLRPIEPGSSVSPKTVHPHPRPQSQSQPQPQPQPQRPQQQQPQPQPQRPQQQGMLQIENAAAAPSSSGTAIIRGGQQQQPAAAVVAATAGRSKAYDDAPLGREWQICGEMVVRIDQWSMAQAEAMGADCLAACRAEGSHVCWQVAGFRNNHELASRWGASRAAALQALCNCWKRQAHPGNK